MPCLSRRGFSPPAAALWPDPALGEGRALPLLPLAVWAQGGFGGPLQPPQPVCPRRALAPLGHSVALLDFCMTAAKGHREGLWGAVSDTCPDAQMCPPKLMGLNQWGWLFACSPLKPPRAHLSGTAPPPLPLAWLNLSEHPVVPPRRAQHPRLGAAEGFRELGAFLLSPRPAFIGLSFKL